ncbi:diguanylate cyclase (GGDEF)-like protein [Methylorubrum rhodinum]|uniref:diguanylate cyclase n=1 Tax=Methylorubrum rhodinum TaxID=29428 RepID=A0A840ZH88_9HYPH|nr:sensor domain-containing diguanylate cyclase [Methylorubrum rhodinum]MBB5756371.1 diguanylate cyclase (GGDEF)-like protein [Methylorubrum rhodinum]
MTPPLRLARGLRSARTRIALGILAPLGMLALSGLMLLDLRRDAWDRAERTSRNLLQVLEGDIARNFEVIDLSLRAVIDNLKASGVNEVSPLLRQLILFDRAVTARDMGVILVLDENGDSIIDASALPARRVNNADRDYFKAHRERADLGLHVSRPVISKLMGVPVIVVSRRIDKPDGSFGGVVLGSLRLSYFEGIFARVGLGPEGAINLYLRDGTRLMRHPLREGDIGANIAGASTFRQFAAARSGLFTDRSVRDGVERSYAFTQVGDLPLILNVALSVEAIEAEWRGKALVIGLAVLVLCGIAVALSLLFGRELARSAAMQAELARLSHTDGLTGLANRRRFDEALALRWAEARRSGEPLALLVVDADHFKRTNDRYGHSVGDAVLRGLGARLAGGARRPGDLACRIGGEEFAILLPGTDRGGALRLAAGLHAAVAGLAIPAAGIDPGTVTVSIGLAVGPEGPDDTGHDLYRRADAALYAAKEGGRNQTRSAPRPEPEAMRLVEA